MILTKSDLDKIRERERKASGGDWRIDGDRWQNDDYGNYPPEFVRWWACTPDIKNYEQAIEDQKFINHARIDIPNLLETIDHLLEEVTKLELELEIINQKKEGE